MATTNISIRMDSDLKSQADALFSELGMNLSTAFNIFVRQSLRDGGIPFEIKMDQPNKETMAAIQLEGERFDLDERIAAELFGLSTPKPKNLSRKKMDECRERYDHGKLSVPLSLPEKRKQEETEIDNEADYSTVGEYTKALSNMTLDELALDRF